MGFEQFLASTIDFLMEVAPIGGLLGGIGAIVAIIFLWLNLHAIRKQIELQNKGVLVVDITDIFGRGKSPKIGIEVLKIKYRYLQTGRVPLIMKTAELDARDSKNIDVKGWFKELRRKERRITGPIIPKKVYSGDVYAPEKYKEASKIGSNGREKSKTEYYIHGIFEYEDVMRKTYWVYIRWLVVSHIPEFSGKELPTTQDIPHTLYIEDYRYLG
ncbi:hypothetical protein KAX06_07610 [candidate division WOR-3 bacterium]|nr:hypothetical protein [candidate division WOR-3 bacterium]MCK4334628.1 hypothetical protein [candidate division WOR-3 bacterium]